MAKQFEFNEDDLKNVGDFVRKGRNRIACLEKEVKVVKKAMRRHKDVAEKSLLIPEAKTRDVVIAGISWIAGGLTAWAAHDKLPQLNVASGAAGACKIAEALGMDRKGHGMIVGCAGGIATRVLQRKAPVSSLALPTIGYADLIATGIDECDLAYREWREEFKRKMAMNAKDTKKKPKGKKPKPGNRRR